MQKTYLYFDLIGGISGDMIAASLLDLRIVSLAYLKNELKKIPLQNYAITFCKQKEGHIPMGRFIVTSTQSANRVYQFDEIMRMIQHSRLSKTIQSNIMRIYRALLGAEKAVHRVRNTHFHQIGEVDSIVDIASACILIDALKVTGVFYSCVPFGRKVSPASAHLLLDKQVSFSGHPFENITPTGIAVITTAGKQYVDLKKKGWTICHIGYGRGSFSSKGHDNGLRALVVAR